MENTENSVEIPGRELSESPATAAFNNRIYIAHQSGHYSERLYYSTYDGNTWSQDTAIQFDKITLKHSPAVAAFNGNLYIFHVGGGHDDNVYCTTSADGSNWSFPETGTGAKTAFSPAAAVFKDVLYLAYHDSWKGGELWYSSSTDGRNWHASKKIELDVPIVGEPTLAASGELLYLLYQGTDGNLRCVTFNGRYWSADWRCQYTSPDYDVLVDMTGSRPTLVSCSNGLIYVGWVLPLPRGQEDPLEFFCYAYKSGSDPLGAWTFKDHYAQRTSTPVFGHPALAQINNWLYWFCTGEDYHLFSGPMTKVNGL